MRFADKGYYIEEYVKCANCGVLVYDRDLVDKAARERVFCSDWCHDWSALRESGNEHPVLPLPRGGSGLG